MQPFIVSSDLHLSADASAGMVRDLGRLLSQYGGHEVVLAGDVFNLSWEAPGSSASAAVLDLLQQFPNLQHALRQHLASGGALTFLAGNHDAAMMGAELREALLQK